MIHGYQLNGYNIVIDVYSGSVHSVDKVAYDVIAVELIAVDHGNSPLQKLTAGRYGRRSRFVSCVPQQFSQGWLATPQEVLQALWQEVWHSPQPPSTALCLIERVLSVFILPVEVFSQG